MCDGGIVIHTEDTALFADRFGGKQADIASATADIEHSHLIISDMVVYSFL